MASLVIGFVIVDLELNGVRGTSFGENELKYGPIVKNLIKF